MPTPHGYNVIEYTPSGTRKSAVAVDTIEHAESWRRQLRIWAHERGDTLNTFAIRPGRT